MFRLPGLRTRPRRFRLRRSARSFVAVLAWSTLATVACSVDDNGLGSAPKLSHDAGAVSPTGGSTGTGTGGGPASGSGGTGDVLGTGGAGPQTGAGGTGDATGGMDGAPSGAGGVTATGGGGDNARGTGGENPTGGAAGSATTGAGGAATTGTGGAAGAGQGTGGMGGGAAGMTGAGGRGMGGAPGRCGPLTCNGCCAGTVCVPVPTAKQCGTRGAACTACGACQQCSLAGQCALNPGSQWTIVAENARVTTLAPNGGFWDPAKGDEGGTAPDLFCEYENPANDVSPTTTGVTATVGDVYSAAWNSTITPTGVTVSASALMAARPAWRIWVGDEDCSKNVCGQGQIACSYAQPITAAALMSGGLSISNYQNCLALNLLFKCASPAP